MTDPSPAFTDPAALAAWSTATGRRFAIPEIGCRQDTDDARLAWLQATMPPLLAAKPLFAAYFASTVGGDFPLDHYPQAAAYWRSLAAGAR